MKHYHDFCHILEGVFNLLKVQFAFRILNLLKHFLILCLVLIADSWQSSHSRHGDVESLLRVWLQVVDGLLQGGDGFINLIDFDDFNYISELFLRVLAVFVILCRSSW